MTKEDSISKALSYFNKGYACSQSVLLAFSEKLNLDEQIAKLISSTFGGGMGRLRDNCGEITGGFMVLGLKYGNTDTKLAAYKKVREFNHAVLEIHGTSNCSELLKKHASEANVADRKHHKIICRKVVGDVTGLIYDMVM